MQSCTAACVIGSYLPSCKLGTWQPFFQSQTLVGPPPTSLCQQLLLCLHRPSVTSVPLPNGASHAPSYCHLLLALRSQSTHTTLPVSPVF